MRNRVDKGRSAHDPERGHHHPVTERTGMGWATGNLRTRAGRRFPGRAPQRLPCCDRAAEADVATVLLSSSAGERLSTCANCDREQVFASPQDDRVAIDGGAVAAVRGSRIAERAAKFWCAGRTLLRHLRDRLSPAVFEGNPVLRRSCCGRTNWPGS